MKTDKEIQRDIIDELQWEPMVDSTGIEVRVDQGVVTLNGHVCSLAGKMIAGKVARRVRGVKAVNTNLEVMLSPGNQLPDGLITQNVLNVLKWHTTVPKDRIRVKVENSKVCLDGDVDWAYQKEEVCNAICCQKGIKQVTDRISVKPQPDALLIKEGIAKALQRRANLEASGIQIEIRGDQVILKGRVHSWNERTEAAHVAWSAPGVSTVDDQIVIDYD
ncbi:Osmotically-inducible protein OsmY, contains BON domain [Mucilaginibacter sp. OK268]|uniref:BON domain-containing protein n=1 Tax=Mucilaginibacter sp. OK268 TaxID=1881048 RepID=UPI0008893F29|nr:BON domain-containing protein [Mucilaginibacter sp. OK268]SDP96968.1 Osmotically-inducible protein OsmY, contains BON domain [Mucilaginibacter sp. OK268]